ncbi:TetR/AcrR family transcriptional regulator [Luteimicrobium subarcticum]|uniref:TetR family transcriptional regulator n=1 Tax=Luteimicrobium subarcticum TaxID=620910 RepID=A0A2M8WJB8_9MICO|nr:TetR/AcrR family transcriptional regulator [Luteimicrobium subarcticum]PJI91027.1 TetR family transcriptional regulator [Luteimicrobium subarcticum]
MPTPRQVAREHTQREILRIGREQLAEVGPAQLSLRAVARELGVVSSAVYRYVASRDELLTLLIVDAYDELGDAVEDALAAAPADDPRGRVLVSARAVREWAVREKARYALLYGTPVPGYAAPAERTTPPGLRVVRVLVQIMEDAWAAGRVRVPDVAPLSSVVEGDLERVRGEFGLEMSPAALAGGMTLWAGMYGVVSFDVFDQWGPDTLTDRGAFFDVLVERLADAAGII